MVLSAGIVLSSTSTATGRPSTEKGGTYTTVHNDACLYQGNNAVLLLLYYGTVYYTFYDMGTLL